jgi:hypothetical protein
MAFSSKKTYSLLAEYDDNKALLSEDSCTQQVPRKREHGGLSMIFTSVLILVVCLLSSFIGLCVGRRYPSDDGAIRHVSKFSKCSLIEA